MGAFQSKGKTLQMKGTAGTKAQMQSTFWRLQIFCETVVEALRIRGGGWRAADGPPLSSVM